ncbi:MAG TPA: 2-amino-4-hydroxy-6-hydroxymethyldihydropteridine diphosphokinase [Mycobacterium sp.]|mgnify:CR=1 FL=1|uniref:2-amino-4-hydroxy-6- hydroxymethyldihydropteridine diphosphokinase n=1 Tax=Mycolicibacterium sp. TaxID=2320850 RepID=UPI0025F83928|nr:2-amino-4-hydroxy-6-hydroxymethyldihydropteridine diphosphokinase [Mycolicibacterium sp.]HPX38658.1 2-amino-4-hydroxy-6-hydroxymethyldihydropteridine diphosphokinase [Mycobacterium sp.]HQC76440.1 2-amino-4-hydroxy-6-hydroxymethyldihydropteridine diphosphokinase [Mycobacterium sp.]
MTRVVLSIGSNMGDRLGRLQAVVDGLGDAVRAVSPVFETDAWGGVDQDAFLNAIVIAEDDALDAHGWLRRGQALEDANARERIQKWGPRTLDVDLISCFDGDREIGCSETELTLPHPFAHQRAFVLVPWLAVDPSAELTVGGRPRPVRELLEGLDVGERDGVRPTDLTLAGGH